MQNTPQSPLTHTASRARRKRSKERRQSRQGKHGKRVRQAGQACKQAQQRKQSRQGKASTTRQAGKKGKQSKHRKTHLSSGEKKKKQRDAFDPLHSSCKPLPRPPPRGEERSNGVIQPAQQPQKHIPPSACRPNRPTARRPLSQSHGHLHLTF